MPLSRPWPAVAPLLCFAAGLRGQTPPTAPYEARGRAVEAHRQAMQGRIQEARTALLDTLRQSAPDLVARVDPAAPPVPQGYQLLPRLLPDAPQPADTGRRASLYSWPWTDTLIMRGELRIDSLDRALGGPKQRADYERLVTAFNGIAADRRLIDAHVEHNWFWQRAIAIDTTRFLRASRTIDSTLASLLSPVGAEPAMPRVEMRLSESRGGTTIHIPIATDIEDKAFVRAAQAVIEKAWSRGTYRVALDIRFITPAALYCAGVPSACAPPARGAVIDLPTHIGRFPAELAVLTTGGTQPHVLGGRAMVLGPRDLATRTLGHEFGHILGFDDAYLRGYRNLGADGYAIIELIPDRADIMASSGFGEAQLRHFTQLVATIKADRAMRAGLSAMYVAKNPWRAVRHFREALTNRPDHYGATFQLAKALDQSGDSASATPIWRQMQDLALSVGDTNTLRFVRKRLGTP